MAESIQHKCKQVALSELTPLMSEILQNNGEVIFSITGNSMRPMLHHLRDKVCLISLKKPLKKYDLPLYVRGDGKYILHRITAVKREGYSMIGDNQYVKEYPVQPSQVLGVVKGFWREDKYISCDAFGYKLYCRLWTYGYPVRWVLFKSKQFIRRLTYHISHKGEKEDEG